MVVLLLQLVGDVDVNEVGVLDVIHVLELLLVGTLGLGLVERRLRLLSLGLHLLTDSIVFRLRLAKLAVGRVPLLFQLLGVLVMAFPQVLESLSDRLQGVGNTCDEVVAVVVVLGGSRLDRRELG